MPFTPDAPFPKTRGVTLRSKDWNDLIMEVQRLDTAKVNKIGDTMSGPLKIGGALSVTVPGSATAINALSLDVASFTTQANAEASYFLRIRDVGAASPAFFLRGDGRLGLGTNAPDRQLTIQSAAAAYLNVRASSGAVEVLLGADGGGGIVSTMTNHDLQLRAGSNKTYVTIQSGGDISINQNSALSFGSQVRQMINLWSTGYGIGVQSSTHYFRSSGNFAWYVGGSHSNGELDGGGGALRMVIHRNGNVGIDTSAPAVKFHVVGNRIRLDKVGSTQSLDLRADGSALDLQSNGADLFINNNTNTTHIRNLRYVTIGIDSTREIKQNIANLSADEALTLLQGLNTVKYELKADDNHEPQIGFIAEETPDLLTTSDKKAIKSFGIVAILSKVVQVQQQQISSLQAELDSLKGRIN
jgi:Chaperone of endosialidase